MIKIVADTLSSIPVEKAKQIGIPYLPQIIVFGEESYRDDSEITQKIFLEKLKSSKDLPKTAAPPPILYNPIYQEAQDKGDSLLVVCPSSELSGTYRSAQVAAQDFPGLNIRIVDTRSVGAGMGAIVLKCIEWAEHGLDLDTIEHKIIEMAPRERDYFFLDTLEFLRRGGRIGGAQALIGSILQVKPILTLKNGRVEPFESQRTHHRGIARLEELVISNCPRTSEAHLCIQHGGAEEEAKSLAEKLSISMGIPEVPIYELPPAILVHAGPGVLAATFFVE